ncbi:MAG: hypothetical protein FWF37_02865 [Chloroflexi bacterium]|nr:hypothetical protein [Chloroflexota bacterium]
MDYILFSLPIFLLLWTVLFFFIRRERRFYEYNGHYIEIFRSDINRYIIIDGTLVAQKKNTFWYINPPTLEIEQDDMHILFYENFFDWPGHRIKVRINGHLVNDKRKK